MNALTTVADTGTVNKLHSFQQLSRFSKYGIFSEYVILDINVIIENVSESRTEQLKHETLVISVGTFVCERVKQLNYILRRQIPLRMPFQDF